MASISSPSLLGFKQLTVHLVDCLKNPEVLRPETCAVKTGKGALSSGELHLIFIQAGEGQLCFQRDSLTRLPVTWLKKKKDGTLGVRIKFLQTGVVHGHASPERISPGVTHRFILSTPFLNCGTTSVNEDDARR